MNASPAPRRGAAATAWSWLLLGVSSRVVLALLGGLVFWSLMPVVAGWHPLVVMTGSMQPRIDAGDIVIYQGAPAAAIQPGQVVIVHNPARPGELLSHRLLRRGADGDLITKGDANAAADSTPVPPSAVLGRGRLRVPYVGNPIVWAHDRDYPHLLGLGVLAALTLLGANAGRDDTPADDDPGPARTGRGRGRWRPPVRKATVAGAAVSCVALSLGSVGAAYAATTVNPANRLTAARYYDLGANYTWGDNLDGQLALNDKTSRSSPTRVGANTKWTAVAAGGYHTCAMLNDGTMGCSGNNYYGQLGNGGTTGSSVFVQVGTATDWSTVSTGDYHTCALKYTGTLWCWGSNTNGQLGKGGASDQLSHPSPIQVTSATDWAAVSAYGNNTCALKNTGTLWCWGDNAYGQIGDGSTTGRTSPVQVGASSSWSSVATGGEQTCAIQSTGTLWCWGDNQYGQLGNGSTINQPRPIQVGGNSTWTNVSSGLYEVCGRQRTGTLWCWGYNNYGELGLGDTTNRSTPVRVGSSTTWTTVSLGYYHSCAQRADGSGWCWGDNGNGQVGNGTTTNVNTPTQLAITVQNIVAGGYMTMAIS